MNNDGYTDFETGQDEHVNTQETRFKGEKGQSYRASIVRWPGLEDGKPDLTKNPKWLSAWRSYAQGVGYFLNKGPEYSKLGGGKKPSQAIATILVIWPTRMEKGKLVIDADRLKEGDFHVKSWVINPAKYETVKTNHSEFGLGEHDLLLKCINPQYQNFDISLCKESLLHKILTSDKATAHAKRIIEQAQEINMNLGNEMCRDMPLDEIREKLGMTTSSPVGAEAVAASEDMDGVLDDLGI